MANEEKEDMKGFGVEDSLRMIQNLNGFREDLQNCQDCFACLRSYERERAGEVLQRVIHKYEPQINFWGQLSNGVYVDHNLPIELQTDERIKVSLQYISNNIPLYAAIREGDKKLTEKLFNKMFAQK